MFDRSISPQRFLSALRELEEATARSQPKALHNGIKRLRARAEGFDGTKFDELVNFVSHPPKKVSAQPHKSPVAKSKRGPSLALTKEFIEALEKVETDEKSFQEILEQYSKSCTAKALRDAAAAYAASSIPKTKSAALDLCIGERANRIRTKRKIAESAKATPW